MPKLSLSLKVSFHRESGQFIKYIGKSYGKDGKLKPKAHYLGSDRGPALKQAAELLSAWYQLLASGVEAWPRDFSFERSAVPLLVSYQSRVVQPTASVPDIEVREAAKRYIDSIRLRRDAKQVSHYYYLGMEQRVNHAIRYLGQKKLLSEIGEAELTQMVLKIVGRPLVKRINNEPHPMALITCRRMLGSVKAFLVWCYETELWNNRPRRFDRLFRYKAVLSEVEKEALLNGNTAEPPHFTVEELTKLYSSCSDRHKLWLLLCLNCGFSTAELDSLKRYEIKGIETDAPFIERFRQKSGVYAKWSLWSETAQLLRRFIAPPNPDEAVLLTEKRQRLKRPSERGHRDAVWQAWCKITERCGVSGSPKLLRKTGAWMVKQIDGLEVSEMYLAHQEPGLNKAYAGRRWGKMHAALAEMRIQLQPMFDAAVSTGEARYIKANAKKRGRDRKPRRRRRRAEMAAFREQQLQATQTSVAVSA